MTEIPNPPDFTHLLVVPHVRVQNANAVSSPLTHGFPSITAFLGQMGALERNVRSQDIDWAFKAVGVVCHDYAEQVVEPAYPGAPTTFCLTRNPVDKDGGTAAIVEEGRIHLDITLIYAVFSDALLHADDATLQTKADAMGECIACMRLAGGSILHRPWTRQHRPRLLPWSDQVDTASQFRKLLLRLLPGHVLVGRDDLLAQRLAHLRPLGPMPPHSMRCCRCRASTGTASSPPPPSRRPTPPRRAKHPGAPPGTGRTTAPGRAGSCPFRWATGASATCCRLAVWPEPAMHPLPSALSKASTPSANGGGRIACVRSRSCSGGPTATPMPAITAAAAAMA